MAVSVVETVIPVRAPSGPSGPPAPFPGIWFPTSPLGVRWAATPGVRTVGAKRVLVVDDDPSIRETVGEILVEEGYEVVSAGDGAEALALLDEHAQPFDLVLLDMRLPRVNGWDFAAAYRQRPGPHAPLVAMTAAHNAHQWAREIAAADVLPKPFELDDLLDLVERLTGAS